MKSKTKKVKIAIIMILIVFLMPVKVLASNYSNIEDRILQNQKMYNATNSMTITQRARYNDELLRDMKETNYKGMTKEQQQRIQNLANNVILGENKDRLTDEEKIIKFYEWIKENFYYYKTPSKIEKLGTNQDNPYYLLTKEYEELGKIRARRQGYAAMLVALARSQGITSRVTEGYYNEQTGYNKYWPSDITENDINHYFTEIYIDGKWIIADPFANSNKRYDDVTNAYIKEMEILGNEYLNPSIQDFSKTHVILKKRSGSRELKYTTNTFESGKLITFLNKKYNNKTNGKRINAYYNVNDRETWYVQNDKLSQGDGNGKIEKIYWPTDVGLSGSLELNGFGALRILKVLKNNITSLSLQNCPSIEQVLTSQNKMKTITVTNSKKLKLLSVQGNNSTYVKYNFGTSLRTAIIKTTAGGTLSVRYEKTSSGKHMHQLRTFTKQGYEFKGWYKNDKKISSKKSITVYNTQSFTYTAKYAKKSYIIISIDKQKLWYYNKGTLVLSSNVVTGTRGKYDTPKGTYKIRGKAKGAYLIGADYRTWVDYWMLIDSKTQIGLHDAQWRYNFGGSIYRYNGSHGCINLPYSVAKRIYSIVPTGTTVIVK